MPSLPPFLLLLPLLRRPPLLPQARNLSLGNALSMATARPAAAAPRPASAMPALSLRVREAEAAVVLPVLLLPQLPPQLKLRLPLLPPLPLLRRPLQLGRSS